MTFFSAALQKACAAWSKIQTQGKMCISVFHDGQHVRSGHHTVIMYYMDGLVAHKNQEMVNSGYKGMARGLRTTGVGQQGENIRTLDFWTLTFFSNVMQQGLCVM